MKDLLIYVRDYIMGLGIMLFGILYSVIKIPLVIIIWVLEKPYRVLLISAHFLSSFSLGETKKIVLSAISEKPESVYVSYSKSNMFRRKKQRAYAIDTLGNNGYYCYESSWHDYERIMKHPTEEFYLRDDS